MKMSRAFLTAGDRCGQIQWRPFRSLRTCVRLMVNTIKNLGFTRCPTCLRTLRSITKSYSSSTVHNNGNSRAFARFIAF